MTSRQAPSSGTALYLPIKRFLESHGFEVKDDVCGCDIVGLALGEPPLVVITELKLSFSMELLIQAVERTRSTDIVYVAVPATRRGRDQDTRVHRLCRMLSIGLLAVDLRLAKVTVLAEPTPYRPRPNLPQRRRLVAEHRRRKGDPTPGGSSRQPIMTAYRQRALACAEAMRDGPKHPRELKVLAEDAGAILLRNVYGWFERKERGLYALTPEGRGILDVAEPGEQRLLSASAQSQVEPVRDAPDCFMRHSGAGTSTPACSCCLSS